MKDATVAVPHQPRLGWRTVDVRRVIALGTSVRRTHVCGLVAFLFAVLPIHAQSTDSSFVVRHRSATIGGVGVVATLALFSLDETLLQHLRAPSPQHSTALRNSADFFDALGGPGAVITSASLLGTGLLSRNTTVTQLGIRSAEALVIGSTTTAILKGAFGRQRPFLDEHAPRMFAFGRGFGTPGRTSMPSGHATSAFAVATALSHELRVRAPRVGRVAVPMLYCAATLVAVSRVYGAHHWPSDVAAGATIGTLSGMLVTRGDVEVGATGVRWRF